MTDKCKSCNVNTGRTNKGIKCESCDDTFHVNCVQNMPSALKKFLMTNDYDSWTCTQCKVKIKTLSQENNRLKSENSRLTTENEQLRMRMDNLETQFRSFKAELKTDILQELRRDSPTPTVNNSI